jgi:hypothetical protein
MSQFSESSLATRHWLWRKALTSPMPSRVGPPLTPGRDHKNVGTRNFGRDARGTDRIGRGMIRTVD